MAQISAHKGGSEAGPGATMAAYRHALTSGAEYAEFDIRKTADDVLVVSHDAVSTPEGPLISELTYAELCDRLGDAVPRAEEVMELLGGKLRGHLDLKEAGFEEQLVSVAMATFGPGNFVVTTGIESSLRRIKQAYPGVRTALSLGRDLTGLPRRQQAAIRYSEIRPLPRVRACGADWVAVHYRLTRLGVLAECWRHGVGVMVWTVDADSLIDKFLTDRRVSVLVTNRPVAAVRRRAELAPQHEART